MNYTLLRFARNPLVSFFLLKNAKLFLNPQDQVVLRWKLENNETALRLDYPLNAHSVVFDVGGYKGDFAYDIYKKYHCTIYSFEPILDYAVKIQERFKKQKKIRVMPFGLAGKDTKIPLYLGDDATSQFQKTATKVMVDLKDIKKVLKENSISQVDLMKLNIEGGEYDLLDYIIQAKLIKKFTHIQIQFHHFVKYAKVRRAKIQKALEKTHVCTYNYPFVWENWTLKK